MIHRPDRSPRISTYRCVASVLVLALACVAAPPVLAQTEQATPSAPKLKVAFIGDSTGDGMWGGMSQLSTRNACLKSAIDLGRFAKNSTGLTRSDRFNWAEETKRIGETYKPSLYMMSLGLNDRQSVVVNGQVTPENSPAYPEKYKERVTTVLESAASTKASLLWVGLPAMRVPASDKDARHKNQFFAEAIADFGAHNIHYADPWKLNPAAEEDKFSSYGPDINGRIVQIRASDGEHFTPTGDLLVAVYLLPKMLTILAERGEPVCAKTEGQTQ
jgi:hypothetical protein